MEQSDDKLLLSIQIFAREDGPEMVAGTRFTDHQAIQIGQVLGMVNGYIKTMLLNVYKSLGGTIDQSMLLHSFFEETIDPDNGTAKFYLRTIPDDEPDAPADTGPAAG